MRLSIDSLQHLQGYFQVFVPVLVACRRLLRGADCSACADVRSFRTPRCRSGVDLDDLGARKDYEEMLAKKWRLGTDEDALVLRLNVQANFPEQRRAQAGPLSGHACTTRVRKTKVRTTPVPSQQCECQQCERVNSAKRQECECQ